MTTEIVVAQRVELDDLIGYVAHSLTESSLKMCKRDVAAYLVYAQKQGLDPLLPTTLAAFRYYMKFHTSKSPLTINRMLAAVKRIMKEAYTHVYGLLTS